MLLIIVARSVLDNYSKSQQCPGVTSNRLALQCYCLEILARQESFVNGKCYPSFGEKFPHHNGRTFAFLSGNSSPSQGEFFLFQRGNVSPSQREMFPIPRGKCFPSPGELFRCLQCFISEGEDFSFQMGNISRTVIWETFPLSNWGHFPLPKGKYFHFPIGKCLPCQG